MQGDLTNIGCIIVYAQGKTTITSTNFTNIVYKGVYKSLCVCNCAGVLQLK